MIKIIKKILLSSLFESLGITVLSSAYAFWKGVIYVWWYYPIEIAVVFVGLILVKIGIEIFYKK